MAVVLNLFASKYHLEIFLYMTDHKLLQKIKYFDFFGFFNFFIFFPKIICSLKEKGLRGKSGISKKHNLIRVLNFFRT